MRTDIPNKQKEKTCIHIITKDEQMTAFMQCCDVFEKFKVILGPIGTLEVESNSKETIDKFVKAKSSDIIAIFDDAGYGWIDDTVKAVSNGIKWMLFSDVIKKIISSEKV